MTRLWWGWGYSVTAAISEDRVYRYALRRHLSHTAQQQGTCVFVMLNPSTANEDTDDPTIRRCMGFAKDWGYGVLEVINLFAFRATSPKDMMAADDPIGPENDEYIAQVAKSSSCLVLAWGANGGYRGRDGQVLDMVYANNPKHLGLTKQGHPRHPLYVSKTQELQAIHA